MSETPDVVGLTGARLTFLNVARLLTALFVLGVAVEFFLAGLGTFGLTGRIDDDRATTSFDPHRMTGNALIALSLLILVLLAVARPPGRGLRLAAALVLLMLVQYALADRGTHTHVLGAFHALNGLLILGAAGLLAVEMRGLRPSP